MPRCDGAREVTSRAPMTMRPAVSSSSPATARNSVDFPHPDGPTITVNSPSATSIDMSFRTSVAPKLLRAPSIDNPAMIPRVPRSSVDRDARARLPRGRAPGGDGKDAQQDIAGGGQGQRGGIADRSEEHTSELQSLMRISYAVFCLKNKNDQEHCYVERSEYIMLSNTKHRQAQLNT